MNPNDSKTIDELTITAIQARESIYSDDFDYEIAWKVESKDWKILLVGHRISSKLAQKVGEVDIAILPVNDLYIKPLFKKLSMSPSEAAEIANKVNAKIGIPYHYMYKSTWAWETFLLSHKGTAQEFSEILRSYSITPVQLVAGQRLEISGIK
jgi:L-ascorbate metabolism protein UlaG (beta-lactamase superfamily)